MTKLALSLILAGCAAPVVQPPAPQGIVAVCRAEYSTESFEVPDCHFILGGQYVQCDKYAYPKLVVVECRDTKEFQ